MKALLVRKILYSIVMLILFLGFTPGMIGGDEMSLAAGFMLLFSYIVGMSFFG